MLKIKYTVSLVKVLLMLLLFCLAPSAVLAAQDTGIGQIAIGLMEPVGILTDFVSSASLIIGAAFIFSSIIRYRQHRVNPLAMPISTVILLFVMGVLLIVLPIAFRLTVNIHH